MNQISGWACFALVALRVGIGWHFLSEGVTKLRDDKPFTAPFFGAAKGPFARFYLDRIWDRDGQIRLSKDATKAAWESFHEQAVKAYQFDERQIARSKSLVDAYIDQADEIWEDPKDEVRAYLKGLDRLAAFVRDSRRAEVSSLADQTKTVEDELKKSRGAWLSRLDRYWRGLEKDVNDLATAEQRSRGPVSITRPEVPMPDAELLDKIIPYSHIAIGACLIAGLFTRVAAWSAAAFLISVVATQPPWVTGTIPTYYQIVETLAVLVVATAGAGQHASLDFFLRAIRGLCCPPKSAATTQVRA